MRLSQFINTHLDEIISEWESFALTQTPAAETMSAPALRDHAKPMLQAIALDIESWQNPAKQFEKSQGQAPETRGKPSAASIHGSMRQASDFSLLQLSAEFRALRATVLRLWLPKVTQMTPTTTYEMIRFNEAIDQSLAESVVTYSARAERARDMFLAILGHDLRAPLAAMGMAGQMLGQPTLAPDQATQLGQRVQRNARLMSCMVDDLLSYSQAQLGGAMPLTLLPVDLATVCAQTIESAQAAHPAAHFVFSADGALTGQFDQVRLHQLIANLLANAVRYGTPGAPITLHAHGEVDTITLAVCHQGEPIDADALAIIFTPLVQLSKDAEDDMRPRTSMGLGLFVAHEIASAHGGTLDVVSSVADGTIFTLCLPRLAANAA